MEKWQTEYIHKNLDNLCAVTKCSVIFFARLKSAGVIDKEDMDVLRFFETHGMEKGSASKELYRRVQRKPNGYLELINALKEDNQLEALSILQNGSPELSLSALVTAGKITYDSSSRLGDGYGTKIFKGWFNTRLVAVKLITCEQSEVDKFYNEIQILVDLGIDAHPNIVTYYTHEVVKDYEPKIFIALELCDASLDKWAYSRMTPDADIDINKINVMHQVTEGVRFLHSKNIIHRDIKPENVLLKNVGDQVVVKIADFGISRRLPEGKTSVTNRTTSGTDGWIAPEILRYRTSGDKSASLKMKPSSDVFSLGCLYYFILTKGGHVYGEPFLRNGNILEDKASFRIEKLEHHHQQYIPLMKSMISHHESGRPTVAKVLQHHMFWSSKEQLDYLMKVSDMLTARSFLFYASVADHFNRILQNSFKSGQTWKDLLSPKVQAIVISSKKPKYKGTLIALLRAIRNLSHHYDELPADVRAELGSHPVEYLSYWTSRFAGLMNSVFDTMNHFQVSVDFGRHNHDATAFW